MRGHHYCIVDIPADTLHKKIHEEMSEIPPPSQEGARSVLWHLRYLEKHGGISGNDSIEKRINVLISLFECFEQPTADALKEQLKIVHEFKKAPK